MVDNGLRLINHFLIYDLEQSTEIDSPLQPNDKLIGREKKREAGKSERIADLAVDSENDVHLMRRLSGSPFSTPVVAACGAR